MHALLAALGVGAQTISAVVSVLAVIRATLMLWNYIKQAEGRGQ